MTELPGTRAAFHSLHALRRVEDLGLATYVAGQVRDARHVMRRCYTYRTLLRGEAQAWAAGLAAAAGHLELADQVAAQPVPSLLTLETAAERLGLAVQGVRLLLRGGGLYPLYGNRPDGTARALYLFTAQVAAEQAARELRDWSMTPSRQARLEVRAEQAKQDWLVIRAMLPTLVPEAMAGVDLAPAPSPDPLPLDPDLAGSVRAVRGLQVAERAGWLTYHYPIGDGYAVTMSDTDGTEVDITVPAQALLAWLLGVADWHGRADLVAYRPGLGG